MADTDRGGLAAAAARGAVRFVAAAPPFPLSQFRSPSGRVWHWPSVMSAAAIVQRSAQRVLRGGVRFRCRPHDAILADLDRRSYERCADKSAIAENPGFGPIRALAASARPQPQTRSTS
jgi:hypothetical protein